MGTSGHVMDRFRFSLCLTFLLFLMSSSAYATDLCDSLKKNTLSPDYIPNMDVYGQPVTPADINTNSYGGFLNDPIVIPLNIDLAQRYNIVLPDFTDMETTILNVKVFNDGRILVGENDVTEKIRFHCENHKKNKPTQSQNNGQSHADAVASTDKKEDKIEGQYPR